MRVKMILETGEANQHHIRRIGPEGVTINETLYRRSLIVTPETLNTDWGPPSIATLAPAHIDALVALAPEVVLLGSGDQLIFPESALLAALMRTGVGYEVMDTAAACRTYNVLMSEGRRVVAGLIIACEQSGADQ